MNRAEHVRWCKQRAWEAFNYSKADPSKARTDAIASMLSDLGKHKDTEGLATTAAFLMFTVTDEPSLRRFIDGFTE